VGAESHRLVEAIGRLGREAVDVNEVCWSLWRLERTRADRRSICFRRRVDPIHVASTLRR
jgi:hypothetical protein